MASRDTAQALEAEVAQAVASAVEFTCTIYRSPGRYATARLQSLDHARQMQRPLEQAVANGRKAMVYAVTPSGKTVFVPDGFKEMGNG